MPVSTVHKNRWASNISNTSGNIDGASGENCRQKARQAESAWTGSGAGEMGREFGTAGSACMEMVWKGKDKGRAMGKSAGRSRMPAAKRNIIIGAGLSPLLQSRLRACPLTMDSPDI